MDTPAFDQAKSERFGERVMELMNGAAVSLMISIGHRTGLFDTMRGMPPATSDDVAARARLHPRYVREWLDCMVTGAIVDYDPATARYALPDEHAAWLTRAATPNNIAVMAQYFPQMGAVEDELIGCFRAGGGVPYASFTRFHEIMAEDSGQTVLPVLIDHILPLAKGLTTRLDAGIDALDVGCGRGLALMLLAERFPKSRFTGYDLSTEAINWARTEAARRGVSNLRFDARNLSQFDQPGAFDLVTAFDAVHDQAKPANVLRGVRGALREDGVFLMQDIAGSSYVHRNADHPIGALMYAISCMHCMTVSLAQGGDGLGAMWGQERAEAMLRDAGFGVVDIHRLPHDVQNCYYVCRP